MADNTLFPTEFDVFPDEEEIAGKRIDGTDGAQYKTSVMFDAAFDAITALQGKVGVDNSLDPSSLDYKIESATTGSVTLDPSGAIQSQSRIGAPKSSQFAMRAFNIALADSLTSTTPVIEAVVGDSLITYFVSDPYNSPWVAIYEAEMARRFNTLERTVGYVPVLMAADFYPHQCRFDHYNGGSIDSVPQNATGPADNGGTLTSGDTLDVTGDGDGVIVYFTARDTGGGTADIEVEGLGGTSTTSISTTGGAVALDTSRVSSSIGAPGGIRGDLTVTITHTGGTNVDVDGIYFCAGNRTSGYQLHRVDHGGYALSDFIASTNFAQYLTNVQPQLVTIMLGTNDFANDAVTSTEFATRLADLIAVVRAPYTAPPAIRFIFEQGVDATSTAPGGWSTEYRAAARQVCEDDGDVAFVDFHEVIGDYSAADDPYELAPADHLHPNEKAHYALGLAMAAHTMENVRVASPTEIEFSDITSPTLAGGGKFRIADFGGNSVGLGAWADATDTAPVTTIGTALGLPVIGMGDGSGTYDVSFRRTDTAQVTLLGALFGEDGTAGHGRATFGVAGVNGPVVGLYGNTADTQIKVGLAGTALLFGPGGSTTPDVSFARTASSTVTMTGALYIEDGTAGHGRVTAGATGAGPVIGLYGDTADTQPKIGLAGAAVLLGAGGSTAADVSFARTAASVATLTAALYVEDGTAAHGRVTTGASGSGPVLGLYGDTSDTQAEVGLIGTGILIGPGGSTAADVSLLRTTTATATFTGTFLCNDIESASLATGQFKLKDFGTNTVGLEVFKNSGDTQPAVAVLTGVVPGLFIGPGGSTAADVSLIRTGSAASTFTGQLTVATGLTMTDAKNIVVGGTTGTKIGTSATAQKIGFFNATPVVQPTNANQAAVGTTAPAGGTGAAAGGWDTAGHRDTAITTINSCVTLVNQLRSDLVALGILKGS